MADGVPFRVLEVLTLAVLAAGFALRARFWLGAPGGGGSGAGTSARLGSGLRHAASPRTVRAVLLDGFLQRRLFRRSRFRWAAHQLIFWSFVELFFIGSLGDMSGLDKDAAWTAFLNDLAGVCLLLGSVAAFGRWLAGDARERARGPAEPLVLAWLATIAVSGFVLEATRWLQAGPGSETAYAFGGFALRAALEPLGLDWRTTHNVLWWMHAALALPLVAYVPFGVLRHTFGAPLNIGIRAGEAARPGTAAAGGEPARTLSPLLRLQLDACVACAECSRWCEAVSAAGPEIPAGVSPSVRMRQYREIAAGSTAAAADSWADFAEAPYLCTLCSRCAEVCPVSIDLPALWKTARTEIAGRDLAPAGLTLARQAVAGEHNIVNYPNIERDLWVDYATNAPADGWRRERADVLYYVGCMTSFSPAAQNIAVAFAEVMEHAGVNFAILGDDEWCCGFPMLAAGMVDDMHALREHNIERLARLGARAVVFNCPSCFHTWKKFYAPFLPDGVELYHATQFLAKLLAEGRLRPRGEPRTVTYHDPCDLGRNSGVYEEPREVLRHLPGVVLREPADNRALAHCCGGGGDLEIVKPDLATSICSKTLTELRATGADTLVVACPQCKRMFQNTARKQAPDFEVVDIVELVHRVTVEAARPMVAAGGEA